MSIVFLILFLVPVGVLCWRIVVSKTRQQWIRIGAAAAVMASLVGTFVVYDNIASYKFADKRADVALMAAIAASVYLLGWSLRKHGNRRHRTVSLIAAILGLVPVLGAVASAVVFRESL
jgi:4-amino-4-deoxy-L-arabinose transferase-like glycosyltransferase